MNAKYQIAAIPPETLRQLRAADDAGNPPELHVGDGDPLRCCLRQAGPGDTIMLVSYAPLRRAAARTGANPGPYLELGPVFIHAEDCGGWHGDEVPEEMRGTRRVCRAYDSDGRIHGGILVDGDHPKAAASIEDALAELFDQPDVAAVHVRAVEYGCFLFEVGRV